MDGFGEDVATATLETEETEEEENEDELRLEETVLIIGRFAAVSEDVLLMKRSLTKSPTGERMEEKILPVCLGMFPIEEMIDW